MPVERRMHDFASGEKVAFTEVTEYMRIDQCPSETRIKGIVTKRFLFQIAMVRNIRRVEAVPMAALPKNWLKVYKDWQSISVVVLRAMSMPMMARSIVYLHKKYS